MKLDRSLATLPSFGALLLALPPLGPFAQEEASADRYDGPIATALTELAPEVQVYNDHVVTLASPWMEGRLPGTRGMELAKEYMQFWFERAGLQPPFDGSYRQPFDLAPSAELVASSLEGGGVSLVEGEDYNPMALGASGRVRGPAVFVGYSLPATPEEGDYESFPEGCDLHGKVAVLLRLEPMDGEGHSLLSERGWSPRAGYAAKIRAAVERGASAVLMVNPPGAQHDGTRSLIPFGGRSGQVDVPVAHLSIEGGEKLVSSLDPGGRTLEDWRALADRGPVIEDLSGDVELSVEMRVETLVAENVGGYLPGRGELADELIVIGAHLDHLGLGSFGSRGSSAERGRVLHPGADDNASGSAAVLMLAERMAEDYAALPQEADARSILFVGFSAEESGLNGSRYYVEHPIAPLEQHALMINFDMIGRIRDGRLSVSGAGTGKGLSEFLAPYFDETELEIVQPEGMSGASDHSSFYARGVPVLFGIIADFHDDYHTPRDVSSKINRVDAVRTVDLFHRIGVGAATHPAGFEFQRLPGRERRPRVRFGVTLANAGEGGPGLLVATVRPGSPADEAGVRPDDRIVSWGDQAIEDVRSWMRMLLRQKPGDEVRFAVRRGNEEIVLHAVLRAP